MYKPTWTSFFFVLLLSISLFALAIHELNDHAYQWTAIGIGAFLCIMLGEWGYKLSKKYYND